MLQWLYRLLANCYERISVRFRKTPEQEENARLANERVKEKAEGGIKGAMRLIEEMENNFWRK
jgi:hypothetical protein